MTFTHPSRGTCNESSCPLHGTCHCGCGRATLLSERTRPKKGSIKGQPAVFHAGGCWRRGRRGASQAQRAAVIRAHNVSLALGGKGRVPVDRLLPLLDWGKRRYGTDAAFAQALSVDFRRISEYRHGKFRQVTPETARRIASVVLAHKTPSDPWQFMEEPGLRRLATRDERDLTRREVAATARRMDRARAAQSRGPVTP